MKKSNTLQEPFCLSGIRQVEFGFTSKATERQRREAREALLSTEFAKEVNAIPPKRLDIK